MKNISEEAKIKVIDDGLSSGKSKMLDVSAQVASDHSPAVKLVNAVLYDAIRSRASDIHIEPFEKFAEARYRVDGNLRNTMKIPKRLYPNLVAGQDPDKPGFFRDTPGPGRPVQYSGQ